MREEWGMEEGCRQGVGCGGRVEVWSGVWREEWRYRVWCGGRSGGKEWGMEGGVEVRSGVWR